MKKKKSQGFTLMELLGVIIILAVIALIASPLVMRVINNSKKQAAENTGQSIIEAGKQKATAEDIKTSSPPFQYNEKSGLPLNGKKPTKFNLILNEKMDSQLQAWVNGFCVTKEFSDKTPSVDESKKTENECVTGGNPANKKYANGEVIYFNPETNQKCSDYTEANSKNENKKGCMKWYAFNDSESSDTVNVILDHNTTYAVAWNSSGSNTAGMKEVKTALDNDTKAWNSNLKPRLIEANEIAKITGNTEFDASNKDKYNYFYLENNSQDKPSLSKGEATYKWLFDYTNNCTNNGCSIVDSSTYGYWTSTPSASFSNSAWFVYYNGGLRGNNVDFADFYGGVRPVITIPKSALK